LVLLEHKIRPAFIVFGTSVEPESAAFRIASTASAPRRMAALGRKGFSERGSMPSASRLSAVTCVADPRPWQ
jgi:hypothetical protein